MQLHMFVRQRDSSGVARLSEGSQAVTAMGCKLTEAPLFSMVLFVEKKRD
jgi:hypothetical protein